ncbi:hypothetical protein M1702_05190, partial [Salmonella enterica subsp. enterica serovar Poona]|uniref:hypothetical protein n=1 Tax=Salmonella enterica TaxID=28901 RepID=UPI0021B33478
MANFRLSALKLHIMLIHFLIAQILVKSQTSRSALLHTARCGSINRPLTPFSHPANNQYQHIDIHTKPLPEY